MINNLKISLWNFQKKGNKLFFILLCSWKKPTACINSWILKHKILWVVKKFFVVEKIHIIPLLMQPSPRLTCKKFFFEKFNLKFCKILRVVSRQLCRPVNSIRPPALYGSWHRKISDQIEIKHWRQNWRFEFKIWRQNFEFKKWRQIIGIFT